MNNHVEHIFKWSLDIWISSLSHWFIGIPYIFIFRYETPCQIKVLQKKKKKISLKVKVAQSCPTLCDPHGILQARILEWVAFPFSRRSSQPRSPTLQADSLSAEPQRKPKNTGKGSLSLLQQIFTIQESNQGLLQCRQILYQLSYKASPNVGLNFTLLIC